MGPGIVKIGWSPEEFVGGQPGTLEAVGFRSLPFSAGAPFGCGSRAACG